MKNPVKGLSMRTKLFMQYAAFILAIAGVLLYFVYAPFARRMEENQIEYSLEISKKTKYNLEYTMTSIINTATLLSGNTQIRAKIDYNSGTDADIDNVLRNAITVQEYIRNIHVVSRRSRIWSSERLTVADEVELLASYGDILKDESMEAMEKTYYFSSQQMDTGRRVLSMVRHIYDYNLQKDYGIIIVEINLDNLRSMMGTVSAQSGYKLLLVDGARNPLFNYPITTNFEDVLEAYPELMEADNARIDGEVFREPSIIIGDAVKHTDWKLIAIHSKSEILDDIENLLGSLLISVGIFVLAGLILALFLAYWITRPMAEMSTAMGKVMDGNLEVNVPVRSRDELGLLAATFNDMLVQLRYFIKKAKEDEKQKAKMKYEVLQAQINPHFLYNTLDSIRWMASFHKIKTIENMVTAIIGLLKYNFSRRGDIVPLSEEIDSVRTYLQIQKFRYGDMFDVAYELPENLEELRTIKFILQPIVENSIFHGFEEADRQGLITLRVRTSGGDLFIEVEDNGIGMNEEQMQNLQKQQKTGGRYSEIGVRNIDERIKFFCGKDYGLEMSSEVGTGTKITIKLPSSLD